MVRVLETMRACGKRPARAVAYGCAAVVLCATGALPAEPAVLTRLEIKAGERGIALSLEADKPFDASFEVAGDKPLASVLRITLKDVVYGLSAYTFTDFPADGPVSRVSAANGETGGTVDLVVKFRKGGDGKVTARQKGVKWLALVSGRPAAEYSWAAASRETAPVTYQESLANEPEQTVNMASVSDVRLVLRDQVEELTVVMDRPAKARARYRGDSVSVMLEGAVSGLPRLSYAFEQATTFGRIEVTQKELEGVALVGITVSLKARPADPILVKTTREGVVLYAATNMPGRMAFWSASKGVSLSYEFVDVPRTVLDSSGMAARAARDLGEAVSEDRTFAVGSEGESSGPPPPVEEVVAAPPPPPPPPPPPKPKRRLVVVREDVNFRSSPSTLSRDNVVATLPMGTVGTELATEGSWHRIRTDGGTEGWIHSVVVADSAAVSEAQWSRIEEPRHRPEPVPEPATPTAPSQATSVPDEDNADLASRAEPEAAAPPEAEERAVVYRSYGRDPFLPLDKVETSDGELPDVESADLVGILFDEADRIALLESRDAESGAFALRERDPVLHGRVLGIQRDRVVFLLDEEGISHSFVLYLKKDNKLRVR